MTRFSLLSVLIAGFALLPLRTGAEIDVPAIPQAAVPVSVQAPRHFNVDLTPAQIGENFVKAKAALDKDAAEIVAIPSAERTFKNTILALEHASARYSEATDPGFFLKSVHPDASIRDAAEARANEAAAYGIAFAYREDIYGAVREYADKKETLSAENQRLLDKYLRDFHRAGMELPKERRSDLQKVQTRMAKLQSDFNTNIQESRGGIDLSAEHLRALGLSEKFIEELDPSPVEAGKLRVSGDSQSAQYSTFMSQAKDAELRKKLQFVAHNAAADKNVTVLEEIISLRHEMAKILGYDSYAAYANEDHMAGKVESVWKFLMDIKDKVMEQSKKEMDELLEFKRRDVPSATQVNFWDRDYYQRLVKKERYDYDAEAAKEYFPVPIVVSGTMGVYQELLGVKFTEVPNHKSWHPDVKLYQIDDRASGKLIGHFFLDLYPRAGKQSNTMFAAQLISGRELEDGSYQTPVSMMLGNFTKPTPSAPALLYHNEVQTFFHEFGHIMHQTLTQSRFPTFSGSAVATDFVEAPSQMLENFVWKREVLDRISGHWKDPSKKIPDELFQKMQAARKFHMASKKLSQIGLSMMDMIYYSGKPPVDTTAVMYKVFEELGLPKFQPDTHFQASFGHLAGGYAAGFYGYLWSEVYAADMFTRFDKEGVLNPNTGRDYRRTILAKGSSENEMDILKQFLRREPSSAPFFRSIGVDVPEGPPAPAPTIRGDAGSHSHSAALRKVPCPVCGGSWNVR